MANEIDRPVPFKGTGYDYKISLGNVETPKSVNWKTRVHVKTWKDAKQIIDMWHEQEDYSAIEISINWIEGVP